jgi:hypothetical protein
MRTKLKKDKTEMNALEHTLKFLESKKAELVLEEQIGVLYDDFEERQGEVAYEYIGTEDEIEVGGKTFVDSCKINHQGITESAQEYAAQSYQSVTNFITFLKELDWRDFDFYSDTKITVDRSYKDYDEKLGCKPDGFELRIIPYSERTGKVKEYVGRPYYQLGLNEKGIECESVTQKTDFLKVDELRDKKEFYAREERFHSI